jgi:sodium-dependent phosphate transporter
VKNFKQPPNCCQGPTKIDCSKESCMKNKYCQALTKSINYEVHNDLKKDKRVKEIHDNSEKFDSKTEEFFKSLQIFTAIFDSFSHGANDVANAIGPFAAIYVIYKIVELLLKIPIWILILIGYWRWVV